MRIIISLSIAASIGPDSISHILSSSSRALRCSGQPRLYTADFPNPLPHYEPRIHREAPDRIVAYLRQLQVEFQLEVGLKFMPEA